MTYDFSVVGAGFAGLSFALSAAGHRHKGVLIEKKKSYKDFIHTTGIVVQETLDVLDLPLHRCKKISAVKLYSPNMNSVLLTNPDYSFYCTDTAPFLQDLMTRVQKSGIDVMTGTAAREFRESSDGITVNGKIKSKFLIGADGAKSRVASHFNLDLNRSFLTGVEWEFDRIGNAEEDCLHVFISKKYAPGYIGWMVPGPASWQVGIAVKPGVRPELKPFIQFLSKHFDFTKASVVNRRGGLIPCGGSLRNIGDSNVMLLGDAAGTVSPFAAGGIHRAMQLGTASASWFHDYLNGGPHPASEMCKAAPRYRFKKLMRKSCNVMQPPDSAVNLLFGNRCFKAFAQTVFFHDRGLFCSAAWKDIWQLIKDPSPAYFS